MPNFEEGSEINPLNLARGQKGAFPEKMASKPFGKTAWGQNTDDFHWVYSDEPHKTRRREILKAHPEIQDLMGPEIMTAYIVLAITISQFWIASWVGDQPFWIFFALMYFYGGTVNHTLQLASHEISHNLAFESQLANHLLGIFCNFPTGVPSAATFRFYHMEHHLYQGVDAIDTDVPTQWEIDTFKTSPMKALWMVGQVFAYAFRPLIVRPKPVTKFQVLNFVVQMIVDVLTVKLFGWKALLYLVGGSLIGLGLHPAAGHFIAEHYEFVKGYETYSYYGPLNYVNFNVGFHNEHHDFPRIPWSRLGLVRQLAPEWYSHLPHHDSYLKVLYHYITDESIGPWSRIKRVKKSK